MKNQICIFTLFILLMACKETKTDSKKSDSYSGFKLLLSDQTGIKFSNQIKQNEDEFIFNFNYIFNGAGVALGDFDNDGKTDVYFTGNQVPDRIYKNEGNMKFTDMTAIAGVGQYSGWRSGINLVDINEDGLEDIYICRGGYQKDSIKNKNLLLINKGNFQFSEEADKYGIGDSGFSVCSAFFDMDNDGDLDLYVANRPQEWGLSISDVIKSKMNVLNEKTAPNVDQLYRNEGNGTFTNITQSSGILPNFGFGLSVTSGDLNQDGLLDLYVANDFIQHDYVYINLGNGQFKHSEKETFKHIPFYSMGADMADLNNDGNEELFVVEMRPDDYKRNKTSMPQMNTVQFDSLKSNGFAMQYMHNALQYNHGNGKFSEIAQLTGLDKTDWSWAPLMADFDNDGWRDIYVTNGFRMDVYDRDGNEKLHSKARESNGKYKLASVQELFQYLPAVRISNVMFQNKGNFKFEKKTKDWNLQHPSFSNGAAYGDLDNDGDLDLVVNNIDEEAFVYENQCKSESNYLRIKLKGPKANPDGLGAKVQLRTKQTQWTINHQRTRGYLSTMESIIHFGIGQTELIDEVYVKWLDGREQTVSNVKPNQLIEIEYSKSSNAVAQSNPVSKAFFKEFSDQFFNPNYFHKENSFDDYASQILLPHSLSTLGPLVSVADVNADGLEDFFIGAAKTQPSQLYIQNQSGVFSPRSVPAFIQDKNYEDLGSTFFDADGDGDKDLYVVSGGTESAEGQNYQDRLYLNDGKANFVRSKNLPATRSSGSKIQVFDFDLDGDLDVFRAGRVVPNQYPKSPQSYVFENLGKGMFKDISSALPEELKFAGMIQTTAWEDINSDGKKELILAGEWTDIQVFSFENKNWKKRNPQEIFDTDLRGWWNQIVATDLDDDGDIDLLAGNLGMNNKFHPSKDKPLEIYCADFDESGTYDIVLSKKIDNKQLPVRGKQCSQEQMPFIKTKFPSYNSFANATLKDIYGDQLDKAIHLTSTEFGSVILRNENGKFKTELLPVEAQFSTIQDFIVRDFNGDGVKDILFAGNAYNSEPETTRYDGSIGGVLVQSADKTSFSYLSPLQSGIYIDKDSKGLELIEHKNNIGIIVSNNNAALQFFKFNHD